MATLSLGDDQKVDLTVSATDDAGNPVTIADVPTWTVSDATLLNLDSVSADGLTATVSAVGALGNAQVNVSDGTLSGVLDVTVVSTAATAFAIAAGVPVHK